MEESARRDFVVRSGSADPPGWETVGGSERWTALSRAERRTAASQQYFSALFLKTRSSSRFRWPVTSTTVRSNKARPNITATCDVAAERKITLLADKP